MTSTIPLSKITTLLLVYLSTMLLPINSSASTITSPIIIDAIDDDWDSWEVPAESTLDISGFSQIKLGRLLGNNNAQGQFSNKQGLLRLEAGIDDTFYHVSFKNDISYDAINKLSHNKVREMSISLDFANVESRAINQSIFANLSLKIGRQSLSWGLGDYVFINDLFAKNWQSFFNGDDVQYLKRPTDALKLSYFIEDIGIDVVYQPEAASDLLIGIQPVLGRPKHSSINTRLHFSHRQSDYAFYASNGWTNMPIIVSGHLEYLAQKTWGASMITPLSTGLFKAELGQYWQTAANGSSFNQQRLLLGYEWELMTGLSASTQLYIEHDSHSNARNNRKLITTKLSYISDNALWTSSVMAFYSPNHSDSYFRASATHRYSDSVSMTAGINNLAGADDTFFGSLSKSNNIYVRLTYFY